MFVKKEILLLFLLISLNVYCQQLPNGFSYIQKVEPTIKKELRYYSYNNFVGVPLNGYKGDVLITSTRAAKALKKAQNELLKKGMGLKVFDAYRPQSAVNQFIKWSKIASDTAMKQQYYPSLNKKNLFKLGFISSRSGHSRGSSIDLTIVDLKTNKELDMGGPFDFFGEISKTYSKQITKKQLENRLILKKVMEKYGFKNYSKEWWHYTLRNEPFPKTYFNFPVK